MPHPPNHICTNYMAIPRVVVVVVAMLVKLLGKACTSNNYFKKHISSRSLHKLFKLYFLAASYIST